jgi:hypothetical protein
MASCAASGAPGLNPFQVRLPYNINARHAILHIPVVRTYR